jgi:hypothetical protein
MVHKSSIIPGLSNFVDKTVLSQYAPTSLKRILGAGAIAIYLKQNTGLIDQIINHPMFTGLHLTDNSGLVNIEVIRDTLKAEISKAGFLQINFPIIGEVDFTPDDIDSLYSSIVAVNNPPPVSY